MTAPLFLAFAILSLYGMVSGAGFVAAAGFFGVAGSILAAAWRARRRVDRQGSG